jgi:hypothetical protein
MIKLKLSHKRTRKIAISRRNISFVSLVMQDSALGTAMLGYQRAWFSGALQGA